MKNIKIIILIFFFNVFKSYSYLNVYPYRIYLDTERGIKTEEIILYNKTLKPLRYKFSIKDEKYKNIISFYPQVITINAGEEKSIKLKLEDEWKKFSQSEYITEILIEQLRVPIKNSKGEFSQSEGVEVYPKLKIPFKIYLGNTEVSLKKESETILKNVSGRELNFEFYHKKIKKDKKEPLGFIKSVRLKNEEKVDLLEYIESYIKEKRITEKVNLKNIAIYEKTTNKLVKVD